jgi:hypothetical protein
MRDFNDVIVLSIGFLAGFAIVSQFLPVSYAAKKQPASAPATPAAPVTPTSPLATKTGDHIYPLAGSAKSGGAGKVQQIHYASTGKAAKSHRVDIDGTPEPNLEATIWLTMPPTCNDGGKNGVGIKFWGPHHTGSACCYCLAGLGVSGNVNFGGEGPHPKTNSSMKRAGNVGTVGGKKVGFKHIIWKAGSNIHQEAWVNTTGSWSKIGEFDRATCGNVKTSTSPAKNAEVEFRADCGNVVFHSTEVVAITPPANASKTAGPSPQAALDSSPVVGGKTTTTTTPVTGKGIPKTTKPSNKPGTASYAITIA